MKDYYDILGIEKDADDKSIKEAYRKLAKIHHPDKNIDKANDEDKEIFKLINEAYQILSDKSKRAQYDLTLITNENHPLSDEELFEKNRIYKEYIKRDLFRQKQMFWQKFSTKAIMSFLFTLLAFLFLRVTYLNYMDYRMKKLEKKQFIIAKKAYENDQLDESLKILSILSRHPKASTEVKRYFEVIISDLYDKGMEHYENNEYEKALSKLHYVRVFGPYSAAIHKTIAEIYEHFKDYNAALSVYDDMLMIGHYDLPVLLSAAEVAADKMHDNRLALNYFDKAIDILIEMYTAKYGEAYPLVLDPNEIPYSHYQIHYNLGIIYLRLGEVQKAIDTYEWAIMLRKNRPESYYMLGNCFWAKGEMDKACDEWKKAISKGSLRAQDTYNTYCLEVFN
ncbi:tetratricopeptide repeat protein [Aureibacter tunicatorum]|uniref:Curved DNA-binding protein CbpA n=1 Tax=Aureibacter tunicatorum TaxID=866807 RepID=A0AAE3XMN7_9BACT|nr:DnaJ domain-containing protein [Aureibacter tunicatorum]MDR6237814.1 curved DNA-binding protein CbpA [Aureibacter tunicatorum]BDD02849.1 hypothetical protein AUTU_03320 [Aureibacter tunicatorum]